MVVRDNQPFGGNTQNDRVWKQFRNLKSMFRKIAAVPGCSAKQKAGYIKNILARPSHKQQRVRACRCKKALITDDTTKFHLNCEAFGDNDCFARRAFDPKSP
ncbi:5441_t:CDS:2 [Acaulospora morrowiae]|uniref:5441_t:CDS:1 n=1 Tax=Acaulospora morrowiae TaxID=94023 RepID=A0A9N9AFV4_9GLOM|nr:5441_t:CDS:2 [Acaulospora morrowiae]